MLELGKANIINMKTKEELEQLNIQQHSGRFHPYTCGFNRTDINHLDGEGILLATENGWVCPYCNYKQPY